MKWQERCPLEIRVFFWQKERSSLRVSVSLSLVSAYAAYSLTLCVLSKQEYPGFSWIYFKVNPIILLSFSLIWILWRECVGPCDLFHSIFSLSSTLCRSLFGMGFWLLTRPRICFVFSRETCPPTIVLASSTLDWSLNTSWAELIAATIPGRGSEPCTTTCLDPRGYVNNSPNVNGLTHKPNIISYGICTLRNDIFFFFFVKILWNEVECQTTALEKN